MRSLAAAGLLALALGGCAAVPGAGEGCSPRVVERLYFGLSMPAGEVTPDQWQSFVDGEITPRFPAGLTTWEGQGQWRGSDGKLTRERTRILEIVHAGGEPQTHRLEEIVSAYRTRFHQESVLRVRGSALACF